MVITSRPQPGLHPTPNTTLLLGYRSSFKCSCPSPSPQVVEDQVHSLPFIFNLVRSEHPRVPLFPKRPADEHHECVKSFPSLLMYALSSFRPPLHQLGFICWAKLHSQSHPGHACVPHLSWEYTLLQDVVDHVFLLVTKVAFRRLILQTVSSPSIRRPQSILHCQLHEDFTRKWRPTFPDCSERVKSNSSLT